MFNKPVEVPDRISTLELSKIWMYRALQELEQELQAEEETENQQETRVEDDESSY